MKTISLILGLFALSVGHAYSSSSFGDGLPDSSFRQLLSAAAPARAIPPGTGLSPALSDSGRVREILKLVADVYAGNSLPFRKDGSYFMNFEGRLPERPLGYYREYTLIPPKGSPTTVAVGGRTFEVELPGRGSRIRQGSERLIIGGGEVLYYTPNHYRDFISLTVLR